ncbi:helix-turn-helix domain-containing protein [Pantoea osteomyelitidis]|uniref:Helix-turn-helix domain-containing protein n=1 Tax=Pantoea osteomyelitidis TaxID=3230026 RepID=A0ABW7Q152_9GAMM
MDRHEDLIYELLKWIDKNINKPIKVDDVALRSGYSKWHLQRIFHRVKNVSLGNYIRDKKLELAAHDLLDSQEAVINISVKYGYDSQQSFTRSFVRKYSVPPATYRRINTQTPNFRV